MCVCNRAPPGLVTFRLVRVLKKRRRTFVAHRASLQLSLQQLARSCLPRRRSARKCPALSTSARRVQLTRRPTEPSWNTSREGVFTSTLFSSHASHNFRALVLLREHPQRKHKRRGSKAFRRWSVQRSLLRGSDAWNAPTFESPQRSTAV